MRQVLSILVQNQPGVLAHIAGLLASRGFNIDSLSLGETEKPDLSRVTIAVQSDDANLDRIRHHLEKIVTVLTVIDMSSGNLVECDLMLIKIKACRKHRLELSLLVDMFCGSVVDITQDTMTVEISDQEVKIEAFVEMLRPYGILEMVRTVSHRFVQVNGSRGISRCEM